jgi:arsenite methyltransferase
MENAEAMKAEVREKYGQLAREGGGCCGPTSCGGGAIDGSAFVNFSEDYGDKPGYLPEADLGLGCGIPTDLADLFPGQTVLDLGSGAGNDAFVARGAVGASGKVIGVDMTADMVRKSRENAAKLGYGNVEFRLGEIESLPVESSSVDRILSNCVLNLVPDKARAFGEMHRVLRPGGKFSVSDIVLSDAFPESLRKAAELYVGCVSGASAKDIYLEGIRAAGFAEVTVAREKTITLPEDLLQAYLDPEERRTLDKSGIRILSITVSGTKAGPEPKGSADPCCLPLPGSKKPVCC